MKNVRSDETKEHLLDCRIFENFNLCLCLLVKAK